MKKTLSAFNLIFKIDLKSQSEIKKNIEERGKNFHPVWTIMNSFERSPSAMMI